MARRDPNLGMWKSNDGLYFATQQEAEAHETTGAAPAPKTNTDEDFAANRGTGYALTDILSGDQIKAASAQRLAADRDIAARDKIARLPYGTPIDRGGTAQGYVAADMGAMSDDKSSGRQFVATAPIGIDAAGQAVRTGGSNVYQYRSDGSVVGIASGPEGNPALPTSQVPLARPGTPGGGLGGPGTAGPYGGGATPSLAAPGGPAYDNFLATEGANDATNDADWAKARAGYDKVTRESTLSDESRGYQKDALALQKDLLDKILGFDPDQYARQFADRTVAGNVALARSGGSAASQQAQMFAAMEGAPAAQAEGARQAAALENQRLNQAQDAVHSFGEIGTATRGQDAGQEQFDSTLSLNIANAVTGLTQGKVALNAEQAKTFADIAIAFAHDDVSREGTDAQLQMAWWNKQTTELGINKQWDAVVEQLRANGAVTGKDIMAAAFKLTGAMMMGA